MCKQDGWTALHKAAQHGHADLVRFLAEDWKAVVDATDIEVILCMNVCMYVCMKVNTQICLYVHTCIHVMDGCIDII